MEMKARALIAVAASALFAFSCGSENAAGTKQEEEGAKAPATADWEATTRVRTVVFFGQKEACPCTRKRVDRSWEVLSSVMGESGAVEVRRYQLDVDGEEYDKYDDERPVMVPPGIYFLDGEGKIVEMLQGEVDEVQIVSALTR